MNNIVTGQPVCFGDFRLPCPASVQCPALSQKLLSCSSVNGAINTAAANENGAMAGLMGVGMTMNTAGGSIANMYAMGQQAQPAAAPANGWTCPKCGKVNEGNFCSACGTQKPAPAETWVCPKCGRVNEGNFCPACGTAKPAAPATWTCPKCGKENTGNFCSDCGTAKP